MRLRWLPPVAAPSSLADLCFGLMGVLRPARALDLFAHEVRETLSVRHVYLVSSGRAAFTLILRALRRLSSSSRVIVPAYTCFSVPAAVVRAELELVPCDVDPNTLDFNYYELERLLAEAPALCVVSTHMFGLPADTARVRRMCESQGTFVVEDAAQAFGVPREAGWLGTAGDVGFFSFARGKAVSAGSGGAIVTNSAALANVLTQEYSAIRKPSLPSALGSLAVAAGMSLFIRPWLYWIPAHLPFLRLGETRYSTDFRVQRLPGVQAGLLRRWRARVARMNEARATRTARLAPVAGWSAAVDHPLLRLPVLCHSREHRDRLCETGRRAGLGFSLMYPSALSGIDELGEILHGARYPAAEGVAARLLTVPVHPLVSARDLEAIARLLSKESLLTES